MSPTSRSINLLKSRGYSCAIVEKYIHQIKRKIDAFGFADIIAVHPDQAGTLYVQTTSGPNLAARMTKISGIPAAMIIVAAGNRIVGHGWRKVGPRGKRKTWECRIVEWTPGKSNQ